MELGELTSTKNTCSSEAWSGVTRSAECFARLPSSQSTPTRRRFDGGCSRVASFGVGCAASPSSRGGPAAPPALCRSIHGARWSLFALAGSGSLSVNLLSQRKQRALTRSQRCVSVGRAATI